MRGLKQPDNRGDGIEESELRLGMQKAKVARRIFYNLAVEKMGYSGAKVYLVSYCQGNFLCGSTYLLEE